MGQTSDIVNVYLISHENVEETLNLRSRIKARLDSSALAFGSDEKFFDSELSNEAETRILQDFYAGRVEDPEEDDPFADAVSEAGLVWFDLLKKTLVKHLRLPMRRINLWQHERFGLVTLMPHS